VKIVPSERPETNVPQVNPKRATKKGGCLSWTLRPSKRKASEERSFGSLCKTKFTDYCWSYFLKKKSGLASTVIVSLRKIEKDQIIKVEKIGCDNPGENKTLKDEIDADATLNVDIEFTATYTLEQNGGVERKIATLFGKFRSMLNGAHLIKTLRNGLWAQCAETATHLENILTSLKGEENASEKFYGTNPKWISKLRIFGEVGIVSDEKTKKI
jgi:hypothetical protein